MTGTTGDGDDATKRGPMDIRFGGFRLVRKADSDARVETLLPAMCFSMKLVDPPQVLTLEDLSRLVEAVKAIGARLGAASVSPRTSVEEGAGFVPDVGRGRLARRHRAQGPSGPSLRGQGSLGCRDEPRPSLGRHGSLPLGEPGCGYFLPEEITAGRLQVDDLVFGYSVPRSADPLGVFESMRRGIEYARHRLGGEIQGPETGKPIDWDHERRAIEVAMERLKRGGFVPGEWSAMYLF